MSSDTPLNKVTKENGSHVVTWKFVEKKVQKLKLPAKATRKERRRVFSRRRRREETKSLVIEYQKKCVKLIRFIMHR